MNAYATPSRRRDFLYHGDLLVNPGNNKYYKRASTAELTALLKPAASGAPKDETAHFYEAQPLHYGL